MQDILAAKRAGGGFRLLVRWEGNDPATQKQWEDSWEPRGNLMRVANNDVRIADKIHLLIQALS